MQKLFLSVVLGWGGLALVGLAPVYAQLDASSSARPKKVPAALTKVGALGEDLYDLAKTDNWTKAAEKLASLKDAAQGLPADLKAAHADKERLQKNLAALGKAVAAKDRQATMREANQVTLLAANLTAPFNPPVPVDVTRLDYYGRELEV